MPTIDDTLNTILKRLAELEDTVDFLSADDDTVNSDEEFADDSESTTEDTESTTDEENTAA